MTMTTNTQTNTMGIANTAIGKIVTNADAAAAVTITLGFAPRHIVFENVTDSIGDEWFEGMASASSIHTVINGTRSLETTNGVAVSGNTFTLTATTMVASKTFAWKAEG